MKDEDLPVEVEPLEVLGCNTNLHIFKSHISQLNDIQYLYNWLLAHLIQLKNSIENKMKQQIFSLI